MTREQELNEFVKIFASLCNKYNVKLDISVTDLSLKKEQMQEVQEGQVEQASVQEAVVEQTEAPNGPVGSAVETPVEGAAE